MLKREIYTVNELAEYLPISRSLIRKCILQNSIPFFRIGSKIFFDKKKIDIWIEESHQKPKFIECEGYSGLKVI